MTLEAIKVATNTQWKGPIINTEELCFGFVHPITKETITQYKKLHICSIGQRNLIFAEILGDPYAKKSPLPPGAIGGKGVVGHTHWRWTTGLCGEVRMILYLLQYCSTLFRQSHSLMRILDPPDGGTWVTRGVTLDTKIESAAAAFSNALTLF